MQLLRVGYKISWVVMELLLLHRWSKKSFKIISFTLILKYCNHAACGVWLGCTLFAALRPAWMHTKQSKPRRASVHTFCRPQFFFRCPACLCIFLEIRKESEKGAVKICRICLERVPASICTL